MQRLNGWLLIGIIGVCVFGSQFGIQYGRAVLGRADIWWTPRSMALALDETDGAFELIIRDARLQQRVADGSLQVVGPDGRAVAVEAGDIAVRLNNWPVARGTFLHAAVFTALMLGVSLTALVAGVIQVVNRRKEGPGQPAADAG